MSENSFLELLQLEGVIGGVLFDESGDVLLMKLPSVFSFDIVFDAITCYMQTFGDETPPFVHHMLDRVVVQFEYGTLHLRHLEEYRVMVLCSNKMDLDLLNIGFNLLAYKVSTAKERSSSQVFEK